MAESMASFLMENLDELLSCKRDLIREEEDQIAWLYKDLQLLIAFLKDLQIKFKDQEAAKNLEARIRDVVYEAETAVDLFVVKTVLKDEEEDNMITKLMKKIGILGKFGYGRSLNLGHVKKEIKAIKTEMNEMYDRRTCGVQTCTSGIDQTSDNSDEVIIAQISDDTDEYTRSLFRLHGSCDGYHGHPNYHFKLLRVLHSSFSSKSCWIEEQLVLLRYLDLEMHLVPHEYTPAHYLPASISNLLNLEILLVSAKCDFDFYLPHGIRKMVKLRHVRITGPRGNIFIGSPENLVDYPSCMDNLQTLSWINPWSCTDVLARSPNLRKLGLQVSLCGSTYGRSSLLPNLDSLNHVQELKVYTNFGSGHNLGRTKFPPNLAKLTLKGTRLCSGDMLTLANSLPNLEALKLSRMSLKGSCWEASGVFPKLKFLKFTSLQIVWWIASSEDFPSLERLVLEQCYRLRKIPFEIGDLLTLKMIELHECNPSLASSARQIKEEQESQGNNGLQIKIIKWSMEGRAQLELELLLLNLKQLLVYNADLISGVKEQVESHYNELSMLKAFLKDSTEKRSEYEIVKELVRQIRVVVYEAEDVIDTFGVHTSLQKARSGFSKVIHVIDYPGKLRIVAKEILSIRIGVDDLYRKQSFGFRVIQQQAGEKSGRGSPDKKAPLLRVLEMRSISLPVFPVKMKELVHLRYIALHGDFEILPASISYLWNLQTVIIETTSRTLKVEADIWKMLQLRHFFTNASSHLRGPPTNAWKSGKDPLVRRNLQTLSTISPESCTEDILARTPNLKKLGVHGKLRTLMEEKGGSSLFDNLTKLDHLVTLKLLNDTFPDRPSSGSLPPLYKFPPNLKKLTLADTLLDWEHMASLGILPKLEVLKLKDNEFKGERWEPLDGGFRLLRFLQIGRTDLVHWEGSSHHFPRLHRLILKHCESLKAVPSGLGDVSALQIIEVYHSSHTAVASVKQIQTQKQQGLTFNQPKLVIYPPE
ncbi:hypothetical protein RHSIM_Rhsim09G0087600 [Rhododendron simsii]|uniref:Rx N-terminal domain-containing protein n=1 Tax=Rhododendron simsii TaxID=118357 RepID=A0A834GFI3_RHOSS|nr:hypothetical protein RHSIM_Rhsim09G0087600 [Rhododendron simsii]